MARPGWHPPSGVEMALAFAAGAGWFAASTLLLAKPLPESVLTTAAVVVLDVVVVVAIARFWDIPYAVTVGVAGVVALDWYFIPPTHAMTVPDVRNALALVSYLLMASLLGELAVRARRRAVGVEAARSALARQQAALRRVATLVASEPAPEKVFAAVTEEVGRQHAADLATMVRYCADGSATVVAAWGRSGPALPLGATVALDGDNVAEAVRRTRQPARIDSFERARGSLAATLRGIGVRSSAGCPITVAGTVWGAMIVASRSPEPFADGTETRLGEFTDLTATAVANAQSWADLVASRARLVAAADEARRRIERDLHDGIQQRLVSLALTLRLAADSAADDRDIAPQLSQIQSGLVAAVEDLRELSHGIHPAILTEGGLRPALAMLARRSAVAADLETGDVGRLPAPLEVGVYYVTSEALTNVAKHARASGIRITLAASGSDVRLTISDDGVGGADHARGSGLVGLEDRVHALGGRLEITSPIGSGTTLVATIPVAHGTSPAAPAESQADGVT